MSGAEVIGVISGIIAIVDATAKIYNAANDASGLPEAFRDVATRLDLICNTLQTISGNLDNTIPDDQRYKAIMPVLQRCEDRATKLGKIFKDVVPQTDASRMERYVLAARTWGKGDTVESLMKGILEDVQLLTGNRVAELPTETRVVQGISPRSIVKDTANTKQAFTRPLPARPNGTPSLKR